MNYKVIAGLTILLASSTNLGLLVGLGRQYYWLYAFIVAYLLSLGFLLHGLRMSNKFVLPLLMVLGSACITEVLNGRIPSVDRLYVLLNITLVPLSAYCYGKYLGFNVVMPVMRIAATTTFILSLYLMQIMGTHSDFSGTLPSAGFLGAVMSAYILIFFINFLINKKKADLVLAVVSLFFLLLSRHRAGFLAMSVSLGVYYVVFYKRISIISFLFRSISLFVIMLVIFIVWAWLYPEILFKMFYGGEIGLETLNFSGRLTVWGTIVQQIFSDGILKMMFGHGLKSTYELFSLKFYNIIQMIAGPHNEYLLLGYEIGLYGLAGYLFFLKRIFVGQGSKTIKMLGVVAFIHYLLEMMFSNVIPMATAYTFILVLWIGSLSVLERDSLSKQTKAKVAPDVKGVIGNAAHI